MSENLIILIIFFIIIILFGFLHENFTNNSIDDLISYKGGSSDLEAKKKISLITNPDNDIKIVPYGCFSNFDNLFFYKKINPYSDIKVFDSGTILNTKNDYIDLLNNVSKNGFSDYSTSIKNKYPDLTNISIQEIASLALLGGYQYISVYKTDVDNIGKVFLTYSPPMNKHNIVGWFSEEEYNEYLTSSDLPNDKLTGVKPGDSTCGYQCSSSSDYYCGSVNYPNIKTFPKLAVYKIIETI
jgi:hypothetical protein